MSKMLAFSIILISLFTSCKNDTATKTKTDLLTDRPWIMHKYEGRTLPSTSWTDYFTVWITASDRDDKWIFGRSGGMELNENVYACGGSTPHVTKDVFNWFFSDTDQKLSIDGVVYTILRLDANNLELLISTTESGQTTEHKISFEH